jgi:hypothetical protein
LHLHWWRLKEGQWANDIDYWYLVEDDVC